MSTLYQNLVPSGSTPPSQGTGLPDVQSLVQLRNSIWNSILPDGRLKTALMSTDGSLIGAFKTIMSLLQGRRFYEQHYKLGERFIDQIQGTTNIDWRSVPDDVIPIARLVFTMLFGVRITSGEDLDSLDYGIDAYYARGNKEDIPRNAVQRAVYLKQTFFPISTYNNQVWDISIFNKYPLVAPVPAMNNSDTDDRQNVGKLYTGIGLGGQQFENGYLKFNSPVSTLTQNLQSGGVNTMSMGIPEGAKKYALIFAILIVIGLIISLKTGLYKPK